MAGGMDLGGGGRGGRKSLDTAINLVPFIDLMAVTISFLIMTAVWDQLGRLQVTQEGGARAEGEAPKDVLPIHLLVTATGYTVSSGSVAKELPKVLCAAATPDRVLPSCEDDSLVGLLRKLKVGVPNQRTISVQVEDTVRTADLVRVLDACNLKDSTGQPELFPDVSLGGVG